MLAECAPGAGRHFVQRLRTIGDTLDSSLQLWEHADSPAWAESVVELERARGWRNGWRANRPKAAREWSEF